MSELEWKAAVTSDYVVSTYLPQSAVIDKNHLILLAFSSSITFIASLPILEPPPCSQSQELVPCYEARLVQQNIIAGQRPHDHPWLCLYLDRFHKLSFSSADRRSLAAFRE